MAERTSVSRLTTKQLPIDDRATAHACPYHKVNRVLSPSLRSRIELRKSGSLAIVKHCDRQIQTHMRKLVAPGEHFVAVECTGTNHLAVQVDRPGSRDTNSIELSMSLSDL